MTRKDYRMVAAAIREVDDVGEYDARTLRVLTRELSRQFHRDNPRFDDAKFYEATGLFA